MTLRNTIDFLLHDWLDTTALAQRTRFADHSRDTFNAVLETCERIAREKYAPFNRLVDTQEPHFDGEKVILPQATHDANKAYTESGMLSAAQDYEMGGMQLPYSVEAAANAFFACASVSIGSGMLTTGNANLLMKHGTDLQKEVFAKNEFSGRFSGTMCLSEPQAGSSLSDVVTRAVPDGAEIVDCRGAAVMPGLIDMRVFIGEPGGEHRETFASAGAKHFGGSLAGTITVTAGLGGMGGAQPLAVTLAGGVAICIEVDQSRIERRLETRYLDVVAKDLDEAIAQARTASSERRTGAQW